MERLCEILYLYHGTNSMAAEMILESGGIYPKNKTKQDNKIIQTTTKQTNAVYLTSKLNTAIGYGYDISDKRVWTIKNNKMVFPVVFTVAINKDKDPLYIDEDYLGDLSKKTWIFFLMKNKIIKKPSEQKNWNYYKEHNPKLADWILKHFSWQDSLHKSGTITYHGDIKLNKIKYIDIYYTTSDYIRLNDISLESFRKAYSKCINIINIKYNIKYKKESEGIRGLCKPYKYILFKNPNNYLDNVIYKNINLLRFYKLNSYTKKFNYQPFDKIIITQNGVFYMQDSVYTKYINSFDKLFDTNKFIIINLENTNSSIISYFTYIRNNIGLLLSNKKLINQLCHGEIVFDMKYHDIKTFNNKNTFWEYVNSIMKKQIILPAKKE